jgi:hypothetical protein
VCRCGCRFPSIVPPFKQSICRRAHLSWCPPPPRHLQPMLAKLKSKGLSGLAVRQRRLTGNDFLDHQHVDDGTRSLPATSPQVLLSPSSSFELEPQHSAPPTAGVCSVPVCVR